MVFFVLSCYIYTIVSTSMMFQDLFVIGISSGCHICALLVSLHLANFGNRLKKITDDMDSIAKRIMESELNEKEFLLTEQNRTAKIMAILTDCLLYMSLTTPIIYCVSIPMIEWYNGSYRSNLPIPTVSFFDEKAPVLYELMLFIVSYSIAISTSKKSVNDCLFITLFKIQTNFLKYLSVSKGGLEKELLAENPLKGERKLLTWIKLHQDVMKNIEELILYFSPVVIIYYVIVIEIVVCGAFVELKKDNNNIIQSISGGCYVGSALLYHFLLSNSADELTDEAQKLAFEGYSLPWYKMEKHSTDMVKIFLTRCNKHIKITAYKAPVFLLNRETFAGFLLSVMSAFVTFCQMKEIYE